MSTSRQRGMTLLELVLAIVIIGAGLAGVLAAFSAVVKSSGDPLIRKQMLTVAEEMLEEINLKPFAVTANSAPAAACARNTFNDVSDYHGYHSDSVCDIDGDAVVALAAFAVDVTVVAEAWQGTSAKRITVRVSYGSDNITLVGWRTDWAS